MKKLFSILIILLLLTGCGGSTDTTDTAQVAAAVTTPMTWEQIDAIPVATSDMTEAELRQICVDFFRLQLTFQWTPKADFEYSIVTYQKPREFTSGTVYAGLPYQGNFNSGSLYTAMLYYDPETGILDNTSMTGQEFSQTFGNHCTSSPYWAWSRVVNSWSRYTNICLTETYGFLPVGDYSYTTIQWTEYENTKMVCEAHGEQKMYACYALLQPADGIFMFRSLGGNSHCRMVSSHAVVVRNADGTINGEESYILFMDQGSGLKDYTAQDGSTVQLQGKVDQKATFAELYKSTYLPYTFAEFTGADPVEPGEATISLADNIPVSQLVNGELVCNYPIAYIEAQAIDAQGKTVYENTTMAGALDVRQWFLGKLLPISELKELVNTGNLHLTIRVRISNGQLITAYNGTITK